MPPMIRAMSIPLPCIPELLLEGFDGHSGLLRAEVLYIESEDARQLCQIIDVAAGIYHLEHIAMLDCRALIRCQPELVAIAIFVVQKRRAIVGTIEREAHLV